MSKLREAFNVVRAELSPRADLVRDDVSLAVQARIQEAQRRSDYNLARSLAAVAITSYAFAPLIADGTLKVIGSIDHLVGQQGLDSLSDPLEDGSLGETPTSGSQTTTSLGETPYGQPGPGDVPAYAPGESRVIGQAELLTGSVWSGLDLNDFFPR